MPQLFSPSVAIVGAGLGGIAAAVQLKRAGVTNFTILEKAAGPGGTWWDNTYPGAECDIEIAFYAYSFMPHDWPRTHASQPEIQAYIQAVIEHFELTPHLRFNTTIASAVWDDQRHFYTLTDAGGAPIGVTREVSIAFALLLPACGGRGSAGAVRPLLHSAAMAVTGASSTSGRRRRSRPRRRSR